jgi:hypothetical protein
MNRDRVNSQLQKLKDLGYIRTSTGGITGKYLFGVTKGAIFLNLKHTKFGHNAKKGITLILQGMDGDYAETRLVGQQFAQASRSALMSQREYQAPHDTLGHGAVFIPFAGKRINQYDISKIAKYFQGNTRSGVDDYYQLKIEEYASILLTDEIDRLIHDYESQKRPRHQTSQKLDTKISEELFPKIERDKFHQDGNNTIPEPATTMINATSLLADHVARYLIAWISKADLIDLNTLHFEIIPCTHETQSYSTKKPFAVIECIFKNGIFKDNEILIIRKKSKNSFDMTEVSGKESIDPKFQIENGLREKPKEPRPFPIREKPTGFHK